MSGRLTEAVRSEVTVAVTVAVTAVTVTVTVPVTVPGGTGRGGGTGSVHANFELGLQVESRPLSGAICHWQARPCPRRATASGADFKVAAVPLSGTPNLSLG